MVRRPHGVSGWRTDGLGACLTLVNHPNTLMRTPSCRPHAECTRATLALDLDGSLLSCAGN